MWNNLFKSVNLLQKGLNAAWIRNAVIRNNIANIETPNFRASDVAFETHLSQALTQSEFRGTVTHPRHRAMGSGFVDLEALSPRIVLRRGTQMRMDGNNVDIEAENVKLAQNSLQYNALVEKMNSELRRLRMAITEGR
ncbi:MAG: flagellar basal body rod protein FlgB [Oscillospiraceae bacterium]|nr:flagellar basal body rod protein FlgB [Oscillospiraceae bacterium]